MLDIDLNKVVDLSVKAGDAVLEVYRSNDFSLERKEDRTPLTLADKRSHEVIVNGLERICPGIPVLSEEGKTIPYETRKHWARFWLVDPLDGTKEFISRNGEFTVNIALMDQNEPVLGVVLAPALGVVYYAQKDHGAFKRRGNSGPERILVDKSPSNGIVAARSRSHSSSEEEEFLKQFNVVKVIHVGSSLKFCMVAEGSAHIYPRFGPMMEWDTAAGHCVAEVAGAVIRSRMNERVRYNTKSLRHEGMIVNCGPFGSS
jgi:3'(2'), 5'-bisphosphate nucleotidase